MPIPKPPVVMGFGPQQDLSELYMDPGFGGINLYNPPDQLSVGQVIQADDLYNVGGVMMIRPGKQAQLASAFGGAAYALSSFRLREKVLGFLRGSPIIQRRNLRIKLQTNDQG